MSELSREAQALVEAGRDADTPTPADKQRVRAALFAQLGAPAGTATSTPSSSAAASSAPAATTTGLTLKLLVGVALVGGLSTGGYLTLRSRSTAPPAPTPAHASAPTPALTLAPTPAPALTPAPAPTAPAEPIVSSEAPRAPRAVRSRRTKPSHLRGPHRAAVTRESLAAEKKLLDGARRALAADDATAALAFLDRHAHTFPAGQLAPERLGTRVLALCAANRTTDAAREAKRFLARYPNHPMAARVRSSCAF